MSRQPPPIWDAARGRIIWPAQERVPKPEGVRNSWRSAHAQWLADDDSFRRSGVTAEYYKMFRHRLMPPKLDGRLERMLKRIVSNAVLLNSLERRGDAGPEWMSLDAALAHTRISLAESVAVLLRHVHRPPDHPKGGLYGLRHEFAPMLRRFLKGKDDDVKFHAGMGWALRLLSREADPDEEG